MSREGGLPQSDQCSLMGLPFKRRHWDTPAEVAPPIRDAAVPESVLLSASNGSALYLAKGGQISLDRGKVRYHPSLIGFLYQSKGN